jgi:hypothetical protein
VTVERSLVRTIEDLERTVRALAYHFGTDEIFIVGSQSILLSWPDAPPMMRTSGEIDAYPGNANLWEISNQDKGSPPATASEEINALFGWGSQFHQTHGFYVDGVDDRTARLPSDWRQKAIERPIDVNGRTVLAIAPCPEDIVVSKLARLEDKDREFVEAYHRARPLDLALVEQRLRMTALEPAILSRAVAYLQRLASPQKSSG